MPEHRAMLSGIDLMLDTFPYNGHTTTCQSIWMGVPVLTWAGESFRSRVGASIMAQLRLPHFVCDSREQYVQRAIALASDLTPLRQLRPTLRDSMLHSALCDAPVFTRSLELAYRQMWRQWTNRERHAV
jgi:predicted O-linked N-acetylglucosamine transferase (SPINDLY family)